jgi:preprotein translocase subunit SecY
MRKKAIFLVTVCAMIMLVVFFEFLVFRIPVRQSTDYSTAYYNEFNSAPTHSYNYSFSPPVSMYCALLIALESGGWTQTSLKNMTISVGLDYCAFGSNSFLLIYPVTQPVADWSPRQINGTTYRYVWTIIVEYSGLFRSIPPPGYYYVDAATAKLVPTGILS